jgi:hypothetical protein
MTKTKEAQAIIYGSFILYAIDSLLSKSERVNGTTIRLKQMLFAKTKKADNLEYVKMSNEAWSMVVDKYKDKSYRIAIFDFVESIGFEAEEIMTEMFGKNFIENISAFSLKHTYDGTSSDILKETREISKELIDATRKIIYENKDRL